MQKSRILFAGVGGQGTLTATNLLALLAVDLDVPVVTGEIHGMAQRGGIVESSMLLGGYTSPKLSFGEADILLGFEPLETLRALPYANSNSTIVSNTDPHIPVGVSLGKETYPDLEYIRGQSTACSPDAYFLPCVSLGEQAGKAQSANVVLLGGLCATENSPFSLEDLQGAIKNHLSSKIADINLRASELGFNYLS